MGQSLPTGRPGEDKVSRSAKTAVCKCMHAVA